MSLISFDDETARRLISAHDGDMALLYIYSRCCGQDLEKAARDLCRTMGQMRDAQEKLERIGLWEAAPAPAFSKAAAALPGIAAAPSPAPQAQAAKPEPAQELPEYPAEDIIRRSKEDPGFSAVAEEAQKTLGHMLSTSDLKRLFGIYDYLALPPEVIMLLLNHCLALSAPRRPSMRYIEKQAYQWANNEVMSLERAEEYMLRQRRRREQLSQVKEALGIKDRELSSTESKYVLSWLDMGFDMECLAIAYDRTVTNTGSLKWSYMNKILVSWHEKGIHSAQDVSERDSRRSKAAVRPGTSGPDRPVDLEKLKNIVSNM